MRNKQQNNEGFASISKGGVLYRAGEFPVLSKDQIDLARIVNQLPHDFPVANWESMNTKQQLHAMKFSGLNEKEQWSLLNSSVPLIVLEQHNQVQNRIERASLAARAKATPGKSTISTSLQTTAQQRKLDMRQEEYETRFYEKHAGRARVVKKPNDSTKTPDGENPVIYDSRAAMEQKKDRRWDKIESSYNPREAMDRKKDEMWGQVDMREKGESFPKLDPINDTPNQPTVKDKTVVDELPNSKHIEMFNLGNPKPYKVADGEYYYVDESVVIGGIVIGHTVVFDEGKYAEYKYAGYSAGKSLSPIDHLWVKGYVNNIYKVEDFEGAFVNFAGGVGPFGSSASLGYNKDKQVYIVSASDVAQQIYAGAGLSVQYFSSLTPDWIQGEAPIRWGATTYDRIFNNYYPEEI